MRSALERIWYHQAPVPWGLRLLSRLYGYIARRRADAQRRSAPELPLPVLVVGNLSVGGTGKTPLVIWLVAQLQAQGWRPGVVSRGYRAQPPQWPFMVAADSDPRQAGDEPLLIARRTGVPVMIDPDRVAAVEALAARGDVDIVVADDGLQHYRMRRVREIALVDGTRGLGNGCLLPAGPLREAPQRLSGVSLTVVNGDGWQPSAEVQPWCRMQLVPDEVIRLDASERRPLAAFAGRRVHALAGIGNPDRFFRLLSRHGIEVQPHRFPDHHSYRGEDLQFPGNLPLLMTEKDAVKCAGLGLTDAWTLPVAAQLDPAAAEHVQKWLTALRAPVRAPVLRAPV